MPFAAIRFTANAALRARSPRIRELEIFRILSLYNSLRSRSVIEDKTFSAIALNESYFSADCAKIFTRCSNISSFPNAFALSCVFKISLFTPNFFSCSKNSFR